MAYKGSHLPEYLSEAGLVGFFMVLACTYAIVLKHPASPIYRMFPEPFTRQVLLGCAIGLTTIALVYSPYGRRSGGHLNPSLTLSYLRLGKIEKRDAAFYILSQFAGAVAGVTLVWIAVGGLAAHPEVRFAATVPQMGEIARAFVAELLISFLLMLMVLMVSNSPMARLTGLFVGILIALYFSFESPISGTSMNPARSFASAMGAQIWMDLWIYFVAPPIGMLLASEVYVHLRGIDRVFCAKLSHPAHGRCIFNCNYGALMHSASARPPASSSQAI